MHRAHWRLWPGWRMPEQWIGVRPGERQGGLQSNVGSWTAVGHNAMAVVGPRRGWLCEQRPRGAGEQACLGLDGQTRRRHSALHAAPQRIFQVYTRRRPARGGGQAYRLRSTTTFVRLAEGSATLKAVSLTLAAPHSSRRPGPRLVRLCFPREPQHRPASSPLHIYRSRPKPVHSFH